MPQPFSKPAEPFVRVKPEIETVFPDAIWNTRLVTLPYKMSVAARGREMVTLLATSNSPLGQTNRSSHCEVNGVPVVRISQCLTQ